MSTATKAYKAFPAANCERMRFLKDLRDKSETERLDLFNTRDVLKEDIKALGPDLSVEPTKRGRLAFDHFTAVSRIENLAKTITWCNKEIGKAIDGADQMELNADPHALPPPSLFESKKKDEDGGDEDGEELDEGDESRNGIAPARNGIAPARDGAPAKIDLKFPGRFRLVEVGFKKTSREIVATSRIHLEDEVKAEMPPDGWEFDWLTGAITDTRKGILGTERVAFGRVEYLGKPAKAGIETPSIDPEKEGAKATARMDAEEKSAPRRAAPLSYPARFQLVPMNPSKQPFDRDCGDEARLLYEIEQAIGGDAGFTFDGKDVTVGGHVVMTVIRRGGMAGPTIPRGRPDATKAAAKPRGKKPAKKAKAKK